VILGLGALRMLRRGVLVRRLNAQETLSAVDLILTDKTGTLTHNRLRLEPALTPAGALSGTELRAAVEAAYRAQGDAWHREAGARPTSFTRAIASSLEEAGGVPTLDPADLLEFDPPGDRPYTRTLSRNGNGNGNGDGDGGGEARELLLGAPEAILALIRDSSRGNGAGAGGNSLDDWRQLVEDRADAGQRLLLLAEGRAGETLQPRALLPFSDPLRDDVPEALKLATDAGIQTIVVTGDHPLTAGRIAAGAGLPAGLAVTGDELATWTDEQVRRRLGELRIVARALPEQKLRLVELARAGGRTVAVTGDGVNDAPALQHADVAVAMGSGAAVARQAADLVLGDDSFATLMHGLREGRRMVTNIQKGLVFLISTHVALLGFILVATVYGFSQPLLPIHILWLEFFIDVTASIAFERESEEPGQMRIPPRPRGQPLLTTGLLVRISGAGGWTALAALVLMAIHQGQPDEARWLAFNVLVVGQLMRAYANRSLTNPVTRLGANRFLLVISVVALAVQVVIPYVPALADAFRATPLDAGQWLMVVMIALAPAVLAELVRSFRGRLWVA
jgi:P-type Ca2+ transporter type 2C